MTRHFGGMELKGSTVLILGGAGLVGEAVARALLVRGPKKVVVAGLTKEEADESVNELIEEFGGGEPVIGILAEYLTQEPDDQLSIQKSHDRANKQREAIKRQRQRMRAVSRGRAAGRKRDESL